MKDPNIIFIILARGGSKGIPKKNLQKIGELSLIEHTIKKLLIYKKKNINSTILVSSDDSQIIDISKKAGAWCPFVRPHNLASDTAESYPAVMHALKFAEDEKDILFDIIIYVQPTSPFWRYEDLENSIKKVSFSNKYQSAVPLVKVSTHPFKMKRLIGEEAINFIEQGFEEMRPRQSLPPVYRRAGSFYVSKREVLIKEKSLIGNPCYGVVVNYETGIDIDTFSDLMAARYLYEKGTIY